MSDVISDEELSQAFSVADIVTQTPEETQESTEPQEQPEEVLQEKTPEEEPIEPIDPIERTKFGRKIKRLEERMVTKDDLAEIKSLLMSREKSEYEPEPEEDEMVSTVSDIEKYLSKREQRMFQQRQQYEQRYYQKLNSLEEDPEYEGIADDIMKLVTDVNNMSYNRTYSNYTDPESDCEKNFMKAAMKILKGKATEKTSVFKGKSPSTPAGVTTQSAPPQKPVKLPEFDELSKSYINRMGISEADLMEMFK